MSQAKRVNAMHGSSSIMLPAIPNRNRSPYQTDTPILTDVHAQRIVTVLNELIAKLDILLSVPKIIDKRAMNMLGKEVTQEIQNFNEIMDRMNLAKDEAEKVPLRKPLQNAAKNVCRIFMSSPEMHQELILYNSHNENGPRWSLPIMQQMEAFKQLIISTKCLTVDKLTRSPRDEEMKQIELQKVLERERKTREELENVNEQLDKARKERAAEINAKNEIIRKLKDELKDIKQTAEEVANKLEMRAKAKDEGEMLQFSERESKHRSELEALQEELEQTIRANMEEELALRKKKYKIENEVDAWIQKYDQDMEEKQSEIDDITVLYNEEKTQLNDLQIRLQQLQTEYDRIVEERKRADQARAKEEATRLLRNKAATKIQSLWRGHQVRKQLKEQKEKKKKGGKGGKKKKK